MRAIFCTVFLIQFVATAAADDFSKEDAGFFREAVVPVLKKNCLKCHAGPAPKGELNLTTRASILQGGESGSAVDLQNHADSYLIQAINYDGYEMPPTGRMSPKDIETLTNWVKRGLRGITSTRRLNLKSSPAPRR